MATQTGIYVVINDGNQRYYLLKVIRRGFDVYCFPPHLGVHVSVHASGTIHFTEEEGTGNGDEIAVALMMGQAGRMMGRGIVGSPLSADGPAIGICTCIYPVTDIADDFPEFARNRQNVFVIDANALPVNTIFIVVGVWGVPDRNQEMFQYANPDVREDLIYKSPGVPPIWIYARPGL